MRELERRAELAGKELGGSVVAVRDVSRRADGALPFGVKDSDSIPPDAVRRLEASGRFAWLTVDRMADKGRSVDVGLANPITYRLMTGSTSGGPVNILKGLIELALGTDGGGSVLAPAAATNLAAFIGPGLVQAPEAPAPGAATSTDGLAYAPSLGVVAKSIAAAAEAFSIAAGVDLAGPRVGGPGRVPIRVALPRRGDVRLPDGADMREKLDRWIPAARERGFEFSERDLSGVAERRAGIAALEAAFAEGFDAVLTAEGPVDVYGYDETILRSFAGPVPALLTSNGGKYLVKAANMALSPAAAVPTDEPACALVVCGRPGIAGARAALALASALEAAIAPAPLFKRYFLDQQKKNAPLRAERYEEGEG